MKINAVQLTEEGIKKLTEELNELKSARNSGKLQAPEFPHDFFDEDMTELEFIDKRIEDIQTILDRAQICESVNVDIIQIGSTVQLKDIEFDKIIQYTFVHPIEANPLKYKLSIESLMGKSLKGKKVNDKVAITLPNNNTLAYEVISIVNSNN